MKTIVEITYDENGNVHTNIIYHNGGQIQVITHPGSAATAEFQRSDEIVKGLLRK